MHLPTCPAAEGIFFFFPAPPSEGEKNAQQREKGRRGGRLAQKTLLRFLMAVRTGTRLRRGRRERERERGGGKLGACALFV